MTRMRNSIIFLALILALPLAFGGGAQAANAARFSGVAQIGGPFSLVDQYRRPVDQRLLNGKWSAVFFGYTFCPDVCPTTLTVLARAQSLLGPKAKAFQVVFISLDPGRDTPGQLKAYLSAPVFPRATVGLTGTPAQIAQAAKAYKVFYQKHGSGQGYTVDHTSAIYLMDPRGNFARVFTESLSPADIAHQISDAMDGKP